MPAHVPSLRAWVHPFPTTELSAKLSGSRQIEGVTRIHRWMTLLIPRDSGDSGAVRGSNSSSLFSLRLIAAIARVEECRGSFNPNPP